MWCFYVVVHHFFTAQSFSGLLQLLVTHKWYSPFTNTLSCDLRNVFVIVQLKEKFK